MTFGRFRLAAQLGAGRDGVRYRAVDPSTGAPVEVAVLTAAAADPARWPTLARRLRTVALLAHPTARSVRELALEHEPPYLALEAIEGPTLAEQPSLGPRGETEVERFALLADGLAAAHALGLVHGRIGPREVRIRDGGEWVLDWTGLDLEPPSVDLAAPAADTPNPGGPPNPAADLAAFAALLHARSLGRPMPWPPPESPGFSDPSVEAIWRDLVAEDPLARPSARGAARRLAALRDSLVATGAVELPEALERTGDSSELLARELPEAPHPPMRERLGRYRILDKLGQGGMGSVYRAEDLADGSVVALKVLGSTWAERPDALRRFLKEARLLAKVNTPYVTNFLEVNEDDGVYFLAIEYVDGEHLGDLLQRRGPLDERTALSIAADVARALGAAHERGIVHRDIKPQNILLMAGEGGRPPRVKLSDFGLARHVVESDSVVLTQPGTVLGTPLYMAPEQCGGRDPVDARTDVYALGATLFHMLAGRPPFLGPTPLSLVLMHQKEPPPDLRALNGAITEATARVVARALAKPPADRHRDAVELLDDLERLLRGEPTGASLHPRLPEADARDVVRVEVRLELDAPPRRLWPHVSNTERLNRAVGLPAVKYAREHDPDSEHEGVRLTGQFRKSGITAAWREHPFEWVEGRRMGVVREYTQGPFRWLVSTVDLEPTAAGGTLLTHTVRVAPRNLFGKTVAAVEIGIKGRRALESVYRRIDAAESGRLGRGPMVDPFEPPAELPRERRLRLERLLDRLVARGVPAAVAERLGDFLAQAPAQEVARIRPLALARTLGLDAESVVAACLNASAEGGLVLLWDLICPTCRVPSQVLETLRELREHGHCEACRRDYELDFARSVELIFRAHPDLRETDLGTYCLGGPSHALHVAAQARVAPGERFALELDLPEGAYRLRGPQLPFEVDLRVDPAAGSRGWEFDLAAGPPPDPPPALRTGRQVLTLRNEGAFEIVVRVERLSTRDDALTAARASTIPLFRQTFPGEVLAPGRLASIAAVALLVTEPGGDGDLFAELGDARAFEHVHAQLRRVESVVRSFGGSLIKTVHEGTVSAFEGIDAAVEAALALAGTPRDDAGIPGARLRVAVHRGPALVATINDHIDYFGTTARLASRLPTLGAPGVLVLSPSVATDLRVASRLAARGLVAELVEAALPGLPEGFVHWIRVDDAADTPRPAEDRTAGN